MIINCFLKEKPPEVSIDWRCWKHNEQRIVDYSSHFHHMARYLSSYLVFSLVFHWRNCW